jgi:hypothetical protein
VSKIAEMRRGSTKSPGVDAKREKMTKMVPLTRGCQVPVINQRGVNEKGVSTTSGGRYKN